MRSVLKIAVCAAAMVCAPLCFALTANQTVQKEIIITQPDGTTEVEYGDASLVTPGETIIYSLNYENNKTEPVSDLVLTMPVPEVITYIEGSAERAGTSVVYSADQGATFVTRGKLLVYSDGDISQVATANDITHIRWTLQTPVVPGQTGILSFKGVLK